MAISIPALSGLFRRGPARVLSAVALVAIVGASLGLVVARNGEGAQALLYSGLDLAESAEISGKLDQANIPYHVRGDGSALFVPRSRVLDARIMLSEQGLPTRGSVGYEIFDRSESLGATSFVQNVNRVRALEGELARTIASLEIIRSARVHLVLPERRLFERDRQQPSASVVLSVSGHELPSPRVTAIRNLVAGAVPGLEVDRISVLDDAGRLLASGRERMAGGADVDERGVRIEERIRATVLQLIEGVTGPGAARVQVNADIDFNRVTRHREQFDPEGRVVRSVQTVEELNDESSNETFPATSASANLPGDESGDSDAESRINSNRTEETINYEISKSSLTEIVEGGRVRRLSVAVAIDDRRVNLEDGGAEFEPRSEDELQRIRRLVRSAIGFDEKRGDTVEVVNVSFARPDVSMQGAEAPGAFDFDKHDVLRVVEILSFLAAALVLALLVLRPFVAAFITPVEAAGDSSGDAAAAVAALPSGEAAAALPAVAGALPAEAGVPLDRVMGEVRESTLKQIRDMVDQHPEASMQVLRNWINEDPAHAEAVGKGG